MTLPQGTAGNDILDVVPGEYGQVVAGLGNDRVRIDWSSVDASVIVWLGSFLTVEHGAYFHGGLIDPGGEIMLLYAERLDLKLGAGDDRIDGNSSVYPDGRIAQGWNHLGVVDGGAGRDSVQTTFASQLLPVVMRSTGVGSWEITEDGVVTTVLSNIETVFISGGQGDDSLTGGGDVDVLEGDAGDDFLSGLGGTDYLNGETGDDVIDGGDGADTLRGESGEDSIFGGRGDDTLLGGDDNDMLDGGAGEDRLYGDGGDDTLSGGDGNDGLIGGAGADLMAGGAGDDSYIVEDTSDRVLEIAGEGRDTIYTLTDFELTHGSAVEVLTAYDRGSAAALRLTGNELGQSIYGTAGANLLNGGGGADMLLGMSGDDAYIVDGDDSVFEAIGGGNDTVYANGSFTLSAGSAVETITVYDRATTNALNLFGNERAQRIIGNDGSNGLRSGGGADALYGLGGDDSFVVESADAQVVEFVGGGRDTLYATVSYGLGGDAAVEVLTAYDRAGTASLNLVGNGYDQTLYGNAGSNFLNGGGGSDTLYGLGGDDAYFVNGPSDQVIEFAGEGTDTVYATGSFALASASEVETLTVYDRATANALGLTGSDTANRIIGNDGANILDGKGGADTLFGLGGADVFAFSSALGPNNVDSVNGFTTGSDRIQLSSAIFSGLGAGPLAPGAFAMGGVATDGDDRILYDPTTGTLSYDSDGSGVGAAIAFALFTPGTSLAASDFFLV